MNSFLKKQTTCARLTSNGAKPKSNVAIQTSLSGKPAFSANGVKKLVPLVHPSVEHLPFGVALELWEDSVQSCESSKKSKCVGAPIGHDLYEVGYVIHGEGMLTNGEETLAKLKAGDSVIMPHQRAWCEPINKGHREGEHSLEWQLVVLRMLLPSELAFPPDGSLPDCTIASKACNEWFSSCGPSQMLSDNQVAGLLSGMKRSIQQRNNGQMHSRNGKNFHPLLSDEPVNINLAESNVDYRSQDLKNNVDHLPSSVMKKSLMDVATFQLPNQTNRLALLIDPVEDDLPFAFGIEIFEPHHHTVPHVHNSAHELFFILSGEGTAFCNGNSFKAKAGDTIVFPPGSTHGLDNGPTSKMYCLEMMLPNEMFAEFVKRGKLLNGLNRDDLCTLIALGCA